MYTYLNRSEFVVSFHCYSFDISNFIIIFTAFFVNGIKCIPHSIIIENNILIPGYHLHESAQFLNVVTSSLNNVLDCVVMFECWKEKLRIE